MYKDIKEVYDALADEESRVVFRQRLFYSLTWEWNYLRELLLYCHKRKADGYADLIDILKDKSLLAGREVVLFGTGVWGNAVREILEKDGINIDFYCDNDKQKTGKEHYGKLVLPVEKLWEEHRDAVVFITTEKYEMEVAAQLEGLGFPKQQVIRLKYTDREMYFDSEIVHPQNNEIFIDGGCYDGESSLEFANWANGNVKKIYAFEPDEKNYAICVNNIKGHTNVPCHIEKAGLWSCQTKLNFIGELLGGARINQTGNVSIPTTSIDQVVADGDDITFIKMDIEGSELEALKGAEKTIRRCKPRLAICLYHKPEDIIDIPHYVHRLLPEYLLYIRHYSPYYFDTVLYAVPGTPS